MALSHAFASSMKAAILIAALRHAEIRQHLVIERDCSLTNVPIRSSDIIILDDWEVHIPQYAFKLDDVLVWPESRGCAPDQISVLPKWLQPIMFAEQHGFVSTNPLDDRLKVAFGGIWPLIYEPNSVLFATRIPLTC
jgi:hypothetical protein